MPDIDDELEPVLEVEESEADEDLDDNEIPGSAADFAKRSSKGDLSKLELEEWADKLLRDDSNRELCTRCLKKDPEKPPYGYETGNVEQKLQYDKEGNPELDDAGYQLAIPFPEMKCEQGHKWYFGEGRRRDIRGKNPILFETHLYNRKRREINSKEGVVDPAYTMDRWGKRPTTGLYSRSHPLGRRVNSKSARKSKGTGFSNSHWGLTFLPVAEVSGTSQLQ